MLLECCCGNTMVVPGTGLAHTRHSVNIWNKWRSHETWWFLQTWSPHSAGSPVNSPQLWSFKVSCWNLCRRWWRGIKDKILMTGASPVIQWLRIHFPKQRTQIRSLVGELRSHMQGSNLSPMQQLWSPGEPKWKIPHTETKILHATAKTQHS